MRLNSKFLENYGILLSFSVVFWSFYFGALFQGWNALSLLIIPLFQYLFFVWLQILHILTTPHIVDQYQIQFHSLGDENKISRYNFYCSIVEISLIIIMGIEAKFHPQLVNSHFVLYIIPIVLVYVFSTFFSMNDLIEDTRIVITIVGQDPITIVLDQSQKKRIFRVSVISIIAISLLWIGSAIMGYFKILSFTILIPATTEKLYVSHLLVPIITLASIHPIVLFCSTHLTILKNAILLIRENLDFSKIIYFNIIKHYILFPRLIMAWS
ncbi:MAG: hypothetical protein EU530_00930 [Promethearchaeota archaeon]|nr:MAG: hypothetical protein EU530_00930 [Candidatus Lokiarchaeota archaeon]